MRDLLRKRPVFLISRRQLCSERGRGSLVEPVSTLPAYTGRTFPASQIDAVPVASIESKTGNRQRLTLSSGYLTQSLPRPETYPLSRTFETTLFETGRAGVFKQVGAVDFKALGELNLSLCNECFQMLLALEER
jgi:hypothetical protein